VKGKGWVSEHFRMHELSCPCCGRYIHNQRLLDALEELRRRSGNKPVTVTSGTRCKEYNRLVGGVSKSRHLTGEAADVVVAERHPLEVADQAEKVTAFSHGGIGTYEGFTHLDVRHGGPARWQG